LVLRDAVRKFALPLGNIGVGHREVREGPDSVSARLQSFRSSEAPGSLQDTGEIRQWHLSAIGR
jgi:hypothetical protein